MPERREEAQTLRQQVVRCRRLADSVWDAEVKQRLLELATELEERADKIEAESKASSLKN